MVVVGSVAVPADVVDTIERDINRTFPHMPLFADVGSIGELGLFFFLSADVGSTGEHWYRMCVRTGSAS